VAVSRWNAAHIELELELIAEEVSQALDHDDIERRRLGRFHTDHPLEFGTVVRFVSSG
jgi:hypothetical protein